ncbi:hypothetical protein L1887_34022 [Cichorium endivia]|nr:hypothetical protein L1887_34022 [Cichorium endivia]
MVLTGWEIDLKKSTHSDQVITNRQILVVRHCHCYYYECWNWNHLHRPTDTAATGHPLFELQKGDSDLQPGEMLILPPLPLSLLQVLWYHILEGDETLTSSLVVVQCLNALSLLIITVVILQTRVQIEIEAPFGTRVPSSAFRVLRP